jgi:antirestriction protein ArdC
MNIEEKICKKILGIMEKGTNPFKVPFTTALQEGSKNLAKIYPINYLTNKIYQGINQILLPAGYYLTFQQIKELKGKLKKGSKSESIIYKNYSRKPATEEEFEKYVKPTLDEKPDVKRVYTWFSIFERKDDDTWEKLSPFYKEFYVFNINDVEGLPELRTFEDTPEFENSDAKEILDNYSSRYGWDYQTTMDNPTVDFVSHRILIPEKNRFEIPEDYYLVAFDTTSASTRDALKRKTGKVGGDAYSREMLVNQITSILSLASCGLLTNEKSLVNSGSYMKNWAKVIQESSLEKKVLGAVEGAIKSYNYIFEGKDAL